MNIVGNGKVAQFVGPPRTAGYRPSLVTPSPLWSGHDVGWYTWGDVELMRRDPQCQFGLRILRGPLATVTWEIPASSPEVAAWVDRTLRRVWTRYLNKATAHLEYGSCGGELTWRYDRNSDLIELDELLDIHVLDMQPLQQRRKQVGVRVKGSAGGVGPTDLYQPRYWWIANEPEFGAYHGRARLSGAWIPWQEKTARHGARDVRRTWYVKCVMDGGELYVPPGTTETEQGVYKSNQDYGREMMEKALAGGVKVFPNITDDKGKRQWEYVAPKINGELTGIHTLMEELDVEIIVGMGIPPEVVQAADTGSGWSGRSVPFLVFLTAEDQLADTTIQAIDKHVLRPGVAVNFGEDARYEIRLKSLVKQAEEQEAKKEGQQPGTKPGETTEQGQKPGQPQAPQAPGQQPRRPAAPVRMSVQHAPPGGATIAGRFFTGGEFIPGDVLAQASAAEKASLKGTDDDSDAAREDYRKNGTRAKAFKAWFGDWEDDPGSASKVVDQETGEPKETHKVKVVYHGRAAAFEAFDPAKASSTEAGLGFYFAENKAMADEFAKLRGSGGKGDVLAAYLAIRSPFDFDQPVSAADAEAWGEIARSVLPKFKRKLFAETVRAYQRRNGNSDGTLPGWAAWQSLRDIAGKQEANKVMAALGYDGIVHTASDLGGAVRQNSSEPDLGRVWVAFAPTQIKAVDNMGTFSAHDPRVRMSIQHAPAGGITIGGKPFEGGEFIPGDVLEKATKEEKAALQGQEKQPTNSLEKPLGGRYKHATMREFYKDVKDAQEKRPDIPEFHAPLVLGVEKRLHDLVAAEGRKAESLYVNGVNKFIFVAGLKHEVIVTPVGDGVAVTSPTLHSPNMRDRNSFTITQETPPEEVEYRLRVALDLPVSKEEANMYKRADRAVRELSRKEALAQREERQGRKAAKAGDDSDETNA